MIRLEVITHSGMTDQVEVENYDPVDLASKINDDSTQVIALGNNVYSRIDIKNVRLLETL